MPMALRIWMCWTQKKMDTLHDAVPEGKGWYGVLLTQT